jgi:hypothetical protein
VAWLRAHRDDTALPAETRRDIDDVLRLADAATGEEPVGAREVGS